MPEKSKDKNIAEGEELLLTTPAYKKRVVIAIDFGSTHCGIAFSLVNYTSSPRSTDTHNELISKLEKPEILAQVYRGKYDKQPTCALFDKNTQTIISFGFSAQDEYMEMIASDDDYEAMDSKLYFEGRDIKMRLWEKVVPFDKLETKTQNGEGSLKLTRVVSEILRYLKTEALTLASKGLTDSDGNPSIMDASEALWVLTVPSIWQEADKQFMRCAAHDAGMIDKPESPDLILALEPECAIIAACESLKGFQQGDKILTLDCGGGTVDICAVQVLEAWKPRQRFRSNAMEVDSRKKQGKSNRRSKNRMEGQARSNLRLRHLIEPCGGNWGSTYIDKKYQEFLEIFLKDPVLGKLRKKDPACIVELFQEFEGIKTSIDWKNYVSKEGSRDVNMTNVIQAINEDNRENKEWNVFWGETRLPGENPIAMEENAKITLEDVLKEYIARVEISLKNNPDKDISYVTGLKKSGFGRVQQLSLPMALLHSFFEKVISRIVEEVEELLEKDDLKDINYVLLCGGFAESAVLQKEIMKKLKSISPKTRMLVPKHPATVVQKGAVQYGYDPHIISTRRARQTIGIKVKMRLQAFNDTFDCSEEELKKNVFDTSAGKGVKNVFHTYITRGEEISTSHVVTHFFRPEDDSHKKIKFDIYATESNSPTFVTDFGCVKLATLSIPVKEGSKAQIECKMSFSSTEISAIVKNQSTGEEKTQLLQYNNLLDDVGNSNDSLVAVKERIIRGWGDTAFDMTQLDDRELANRNGVSEML